MSTALTCIRALIVYCMVAWPCARAASGDEPPIAASGAQVEADGAPAPQRYDTGISLHKAREHFRDQERKAAANELRRAGAWLRYAADQAYSTIHEALSTSGSELNRLADALDKGNLSSVHHLERALSKADHALATWHVFMARDGNLAKDEKLAAQHLEAAVLHLRAAASSASSEYGSDLMDVFESIDAYGTTMAEGGVIEADVLNTDLTAIERAIDRLAETLREAAE